MDTQKMPPYADVPVAGPPVLAAPKKRRRLPMVAVIVVAGIGFGGGVATERYVIDPRSATTEVAPTAKPKPSRSAAADDSPSASPSKKAKAVAPATQPGRQCEAGENSVPVIIWLRADTGLAPYRELNSISQTVCIASPFAYRIEQPGEVTELLKPGMHAELKKAQDAGVQIWPSVLNLNGHPEIMEQTLQSPALIDQLVTRLVALAVRDGYEGLDLDLEAVSLAPPSWSDERVLALREPFNQFVAKLSAALKAKNKQLSVTAFPRSSDADRRHRAFFDYAFLSQHAQVRSMSYPAAKYGAPLAGTEYVQGHLDYEFDQVGDNTKNLVLGVPTFGRRHVDGKQIDVLFDQAAALSRQPGMKVSREDREVRIDSPDGTVTFISDGCTLQLRLKQLLDHLHSLNLTTKDIGGFALYRAGSLPPGIQEILAGKPAPEDSRLTDC